MGSPPLEPATLASQPHLHVQQTQPPAQAYYSAAMEYTSSPQQQDHSMNIDSNPHPTLPSNGFYPFQTPGFTDSIFVTSSYPGDSHRSSTSFDKALPPLPVEEASIHSADVHMMSDHQYEQWPSMLANNGFAQEHAALVVPTFDPRNQF